MVLVLMPSRHNLNKHWLKIAPLHVSTSSYYIYGQVLTLYVSISVNYNNIGSDKM